MFRAAVLAIIKQIPVGCIFDSHFIIEQLIKTNSDEYINFVARYASTPKVTVTAHGKIGQEIAKLTKLRSPVCRQLKALSLSSNIHGNANTCTAWERI